MLLIELLGIAYEERQYLIQKAREAKLYSHQLRRAGEKLLRQILYCLPLEDDAEERMLARFNSVTRATLKPTHMIGGYAQQSYGFNYYGTVGSNRDEFVIVRKMRNVDWLDEEATQKEA